MNRLSAQAQALSNRPVVVYLLLWVTVGFFGIYWYLRAIRFLNSIDRLGTQNVRKIRTFILVFMSIYTIGFGYQYSQHLRGIAHEPADTIIFVALLLMAMSWNVMVPVALVCLARRLKRIQTTYDTETTAEPWKTLLAYFLWFVAFPYLQHHLNLLSERSTDA